TSTNSLCSGNVATITASGATTYTWVNGGQTASVIVVSPAANTVYTLNASSIPNCNSTATVALTVTQTPVLSAAGVTTCPGTAATLMATGATSYSWETGATTASITITPTASTIYSVTGYNGVCEQTKYVSVTLGSSLSINATASASLLCSGKPATLTATG